MRRVVAVDRRVLVVALILFTNALGSGLILPLLPFLALDMGAGPLAIGLLIATLPFFATLSTAPLGALSDRFGRKPILAFSVAGTLVGFSILALAPTLPWLFVGRVVDGASAGNVATARAAIADLTSREDRLAGIGVTFAMESLGLVLGPVLGGVFAQYGLSRSALIAASIAGFCLILTLFWFGETHQPSVVPQRHTDSSGVPLLLAVLRGPQRRTLLMVIFAIQLLIMMMWGTLAIFVNDIFGFTGTEMGYVSAFAAFVGIMSQVGLLRVAARVTSERVIVLAALTFMTAGLFLLSATSIVPMLLVGVGFMAASFNIAMPTTMGLVSKISSEDDQGGIMGIASAMISMATVIGPIVAGGLFSVSARGSYAVAACLAIVVAAATVHNMRVFKVESALAP